jgi:glycosyltransferase involved in cell wall biosynthesis
MAMNSRRGNVGPMDGLARDLIAAAGFALIVSPNPPHDTGGGQRSAQMAFELLERGWVVLFVSHGEVTETVDLRITVDHPRLRSCSLADASARRSVRALDAALTGFEGPCLGVIQVPVREARPLMRCLRRHGPVVYDCIDAWNSELGWGWYRPRVEGAFARRATLCTASAPALLRHVTRLGASSAHLLPNAVRLSLFDGPRDRPRPEGLPPDPIVIYVGALWGGWMDWSLVERMARALPTTSFVFVGDHRGEGAGLPGNCHFTGLVPQAALPALLEHARVGWLPWRRDAVTSATSPLKVYEYLAMGLPVVGPDTEPLRGLEGVRTAAPGPGSASRDGAGPITGPGAGPSSGSGPGPGPSPGPDEGENFERALRGALGEAGPRRRHSPLPDTSAARARRIAFARTQGWSSRIDQLLEWAGVSETSMSEHRGPGGQR